MGGDFRKLKIHTLASNLFKKSFGRLHFHQSTSFRPGKGEMFFDPSVHPQHRLSLLFTQTFGGLLCLATGVERDFID